MESPEEVPGRDLEEELKKEKTFWVAEADFGIMVAVSRPRGDNRWREAGKRSIRTSPSGSVRAGSGSRLVQRERSIFSLADRVGRTSGSALWE